MEEKIEVLNAEETTAILLAVVTLLDQANPEANIQEIITIMGEAIYDKIIETNGLDGTKKTSSIFGERIKSDGFTTGENL